MRKAIVLGLIAASIVASLPIASAEFGSLSGKVVALDAGHGGTDPGASGFGLLEKDVNLDVVLRARDLLQADGANVVLTRDCDCTVSLADRVAVANNAHADRFVSVHSNACGCGPASGTETYYWSGLTASSTSAKMAGALQTQMVSLLGTRDRGVKTADLYTLHHTVMPAAHVELGFLDNATDNAILAQPAMRQQAARAILFGVQQHFGIAPHDPAFAVGVLQPQPQTWVGGIVTAQGLSSQEQNLHWMRFLVDGTVQKWVTPSPHSWSWDTTQFPDGARELMVEAENGTGVRADEAITVLVDNTPPLTVADLAGTQGTHGWWRSDVQATLSAGDEGSGIAATLVAADDGMLAEGTQATLAGDGMHTLRFQSRDVVGNLEALQSLDVAIDATPPEVALVAPAAGTLYVGGGAVVGGLPTTVVAGEMNVLADASDARSGMDHVSLFVDGALRGTASKVPYAIDWRAGDEALGMHDLEVVAVDQAGNAASAHLQVVTVPTTATGLLATLGMA